MTNVASVVALWMERRRLAVALFSLYPAFLAVVVGLFVAS